MVEEKGIKAVTAEGHGGRRPGAGRPRAAFHKPTYSFCADKDVNEVLKRITRKSAFINDCIRHYCREHSI